MVDYRRVANSIRVRALTCCHRSCASHIGSGFSCADILTVLYSGWLRVSPESLSDPHRDRFILSKGHAAAIYYATLAEFGFFPPSWLDSYCEDGSPLGGHVHHQVPGVEVSTGSLGHGLPLGAGMALGGRRGGRSYRVAVLMSDGELNSGSNWEAALFAAAHGLDNLIAIVDRNKLQAMGHTEDILPLESIEDKWKAFGWNAVRVDGHSHGAVAGALEEASAPSGKPSVIVADTVKGKGVSFMEGRLEWHYRSPNDDEFAAALKELQGS